ncbi:MAG: TetR/AcrR family transcriptional regulator [Lysobacterales bacterium]
MNWRQQQKVELKQALYACAVRLFEAQGFESTTVAQITTELGVAKGTFFNHFPSKEHVIEQWYDAITTDCLAAAKTASFASAELAIASLFSEMSGRATASPELLMAKAGNVINPLLVGAEMRQVKQVADYVRTQCQAGVERGELRADTDIHFVADLLVALLTGTSRAWVSSQPRFDFPDLIRRRVQFVFEAAR